jgi:hypothetical protein
MPKFFSLDSTIRGAFTLVINVGVYGKYANVVSERIIQGETRYPKGGSDCVPRKAAEL